MASDNTINEKANRTDKPRNESWDRKRFECSHETSETFGENAEKRGSTKTHKKQINARRKWGKKKDGVKVGPGKLSVEAEEGKRPAKKKEPPLSKQEAQNTRANRPDRQ